MSETSNETLVNVKFRVLELLAEFDDSELNEFEQWVTSESFKKDLKTKMILQESERNLNKIGFAIKKLVPLEAIMNSETVTYPDVGDISDCNEQNTCHVDEFLYDNEDVDNMVKEGVLKKYYCVDCKSRNIKELNFISHSMSKQVLQYIFKVLLPSDLEDKNIVDIGSRIGAVIFSAYYLTNAATITGVEMNKECCDVQNKIISQFSLNTSRIKVVHSDILDRPDILNTADVIIMNVFDFFVDVEKHKDMWFFFKKHMRKGSYLVLNRCISETLGSLGINGELMHWLTVCRPHQLENEIFFDIEDCSELYIYCIK